VDLFRTDDRHRDDRHARLQRRVHEAAAPEALQLVAVAERLADALEALRPHPDKLPRGQQALGVGVAGQRRAGLSGEGAEAGRGEDQVGAEHAQVPPGRILAGRVVVDRDGGDGTVERPESAGVVGHEQRTAVGREVLDAVHLDPEPLVIERPEQREDDVLGEVGVEAEVVDGVVAGHPPA